MDVVNHVYKVFVFLVRLDTWVVNVGDSAKIVDLGLAIHISNHSLLLLIEGKKLAFFLGRETLEVSDSGLHLLLEEREKWVVFVLHETVLDASEGRLESSLLDVSLSGWVRDGLLDSLKGPDGNLSEVVSQVLVLVVLDHLQHVQGSSVEVLLYVQLLIGEVVNESSLLDVVVLSIKADVLHLLLGVSEVTELLLFSNISPHAAKLLSLVAGVDVVEDCELGTNEVGEVSDLNVT